MSGTPLISVIIPCYNRAHIIGQAVNAVRQQTLTDWELIIVDDGSADDLAAALAPYSRDARIRLVRHARNRGEPAARNTGIAEARGRFVAFLNSDDLWLPEKLARQAEAVLATPDPDRLFCVTRAVVVLSADHRIIRPLSGPAPGRSFSEFLYNDGGFAQSSSFFLAKSLAARFPFREDLRQMVDHLFFIEVGAAGAQYPARSGAFDHLEQRGTARPTNLRRGPGKVAFDHGTVRRRGRVFCAAARAGRSRSTFPEQAPVGGFAHGFAAPAATCPIHWRAFNAAGCSIVLPQRFAAASLQPRPTSDQRGCRQRRELRPNTFPSREISLCHDMNSKLGFRCAGRSWHTISSTYPLITSPQSWPRGHLGRPGEHP